ncbi:MAG: FixH family protein [Bacteroidetes bacterium]|nr:FixH family protein [Bacteroidota bacterium]
MKINWGYKIIITFIIFGLGISLLLAISFSNNIDLVDEHYYEQEINYQKQIDILKESGEINNNLMITLNGGNAVVNISDFDKFRDLTGKIIFYRSSDASMDFTVDFKPAPDGSQIISAKDMKAGSWKVKFELYRNDKKYFVEKNIFIN